MRIRRPWVVMMVVIGVGVMAWLAAALVVSPGRHSRAWRLGEAAGIAAVLAVVLVAARQILREDRRHLQRLVWERDGRCGACGCGVEAGATACAGCGARVDPHAMGGPRRGPCGKCGYPLEGVRGERCPECGERMGAMEATRG